MCIDLLSDLVELAENQLTLLGYAPAPKATLQNTLQRYLNVSRRLPPNIKWSVHRSAELNTKVLNVRIQKGLADLQRNAQRGESLLPRLHDKIVDPDYRDLLLNDWGIHHFHLGTELRSDGFVNRTDEVAFAILEPGEQNLYLLDVETHEVGFAKQELLHIVESNWPHLLDPVTIQALGVSQAFSNEDISRLRRAGVTVLIETPEGRVLAPLGGGLTMAKTSLRDGMSLDWAKRTLRQLEDALKTRVKHLSDEFLNRCGLGRDNIHLRLIEFGPRVVVAEVNTGVVVYGAVL